MHRRANEVDARKSAIELLATRPEPAAQQALVSALSDRDPELCKAALTSLRSLRGHIITLREMRYIDTERLGELEEQTVERFDEVSKSCISFLLRDEAFKPLHTDLDSTLEKLDAVTKVAEVKPLLEKVDTIAEGLDLLNEVVANLQIDDATQRTGIL